MTDTTVLQAKARAALASRGVMRPDPRQVVAEMQRIAAQPADESNAVGDLFGRLKKACGA